MIPGRVPVLLSPAAFALRNWWSAANYTAATGNWTARAGALSHTLPQPVAGKRPAKTASNAAFGNKPTVDSDGVDDDMRLVSTGGMSIQPNTLGILCKVNAASAGIYLVGQYASTSYQFYQMNFAGNTVQTDPSNQSYAAADVANVHLWLFSKSGTTLNLYRDGTALGARTMSSSSGTPTGDFYLFSAGAGFISASVAELFTIDEAIGPQAAAAITKYFKDVEGYPLP